MQLDKPYTNKQYADFAVYCNNNNCHIEDKGDYLESVENLPHIPTIEEKISELKRQLDSTDYKIIKSSEYQMAGIEAPYDIATLHSERQELRNKINELEQKLEENNQNNSSIGD